MIPILRARHTGRSATPVDHDTGDIEEFPLLLQTEDVSALIRVARQQGLCATGLARQVIHDYLLRMRSYPAEGWFRD
jgi:hypothetical protein